MTSDRNAKDRPASELVQLANHLRSKSAMDNSEKGSKITTITHKEQKKRGVELSPSKRAETILMDKYNIDLEGNIGGKPYTK